MNLSKLLKRISILLIVFLALYGSYCMLTYATENEEDNAQQLSSKEYTIDNKEKVIKRILPETNISSFKAKFSVPENDITIYTDNSCSKEVANGFVTSGMILKVKDTETKFEICVIGDLDNDGKMGEVELNKLINHVAGLKENKLTGLSAISADITGDGNIDQIDITILIRWIVDRVLDIPEMKLPPAPSIEIISGEKGEDGWYTSNVKVKISKKQELGAEISKLTYKLNEQEEKEIANNGIIELSQNEIYEITAYSYSKEGIKNNATRKIKIDKVKPLEAVISLNKNQEITENTIVASITQEDNESGISIKNCKWIYNTTKDNLGTDNELWKTANTFNGDTNELNLVAHKKGTYYLHILSVDNAGNKTEKTSEAINIRQLVNQIELNKNSTNIMYEMTEKLTAVIQPSDADNKNLVWTSSNEDVAIVSQEGEISAIALGEATITASTQDGSNLNATCSVVVSSRKIDNDNVNVTLNEIKHIYNGEEITPEITVKCGDTVLVENVDYTISYENNTNAGTATITVTGINNYSGTVSTNFIIDKAENPLTVSNPSTIYVQSSVDLTDNVHNNQGAVSYTVKSTSEATPGRLNNSIYTAGELSTVNDNDTTVVVTVAAAGNENYKPKSSDIIITVQKYIPTLNWTSATPDSIVYNTTDKSATVSVSSAGGTLGTVTYSSSNTSVLTINSITGALNTVIGTGSSTITASVSRTSTVKASNITKTIAVTRTTNPTEINGIPNLVYTGSPLNLVTASNVKGTVYYSTITPLNSNNYDTNGSTTIPTATSAREYTVYYYITGNENYDIKRGDLTVSVTSRSIEQSGFSVTLTTETYTYDGTSKMPELIVKDGSKVLVKDVDYMVFYEDNVDAGTATATVTGINNYAGTTSTNFTINKAENPLMTGVCDIFVQMPADLASAVFYSQGTVSYRVKSTTETTPGSLNSNIYTAGTLSTSDDDNATVVITATAEGNRNYKPKSEDITITVRKYTPNLSWTNTTPDTIAYNTTGKSATISANTGGGTLGAITYSSSDTSVLTINSSTGALTTVSGTGSSTITANITRTSTVKMGTTTKTINATKATNPISLSTNSDLVHTGSALNLVTTRNAQGTVYYSTTTALNSSNYSINGSTTIPTATNVGSYTVYYYVTGNTNYNYKSGSITATIKRAIAEINTTRYSSVQNAVNAVPTTGTETTVKLLAQAEENVVINSGRNVNLNLNGKIFTSDGGNSTIEVSGSNTTLKISGTSGQISSKSQKDIIIVKDGANINITGGNIKAKSDKSAVVARGSGTFRMSDGHIYFEENVNNKIGLIYLENTGGTYITGGELNTDGCFEGGYSANLRGGGVLEVTNVTSTGTFCIVNYDYSSVNIKGGTYKAKPGSTSSFDSALDIFSYTNKLATISRRNL